MKPTLTAIALVLAPIALVAPAQADGTLGVGVHTGDFGDTFFPHFYDVDAPVGALVKVTSLTPGFDIILEDSQGMWRDASFTDIGDFESTAVAIPDGAFTVMIERNTFETSAYSFRLELEMHEHVGAFQPTAIEGIAWEFEAAGFLSFDLVEPLTDRAVDESFLFAWNVDTPTVQESGRRFYPHHTAPLLEAEVGGVPLQLRESSSGSGIQFFGGEDMPDGGRFQWGWAEDRDLHPTLYATWDGDLDFAQLPVTVAFLKWGDLEGGAYVAAGPVGVSEDRHASVSLEGPTRMIHARVDTDNELLATVATLTSPSGATYDAVSWPLLTDAEAGTWTLAIDHADGLRHTHDVLQAVSFPFATDPAQP